MSFLNSKLEIIYQDENFVAVNKPAGLLVHATKIDRHETQFAMQMLRDQLKQKVFTIHRLDKATSGGLIFATSSEAAKLLCEEFVQKRVEKKYQALVRGRMDQKIDIDHELKEILDRKTDSKARKLKPPQSAQTFFTPLAHFEIPYQVDRYPTSRYSLVEAAPRTGRKHQIRRHLKHLSHPIIGDVNYGSGVHNKFFREEMNSHRLLLTCTQMTFTHPYSRKEIQIDAPLAPDFQMVIQKLGLKK